MKKNYLFAFASLALALVGCVKNEIEEPQTTGVTVIEVSAPDTKAVIGEDGLSVNWQVGDKIKVNDKNSVGLTTDDITSPTSAKFTFNEVLEAPFYGMYNAAAGYQFKVGEGEEGGPHCRVNLDTPQTYVKGSFDARVATYWGVNKTKPALDFAHAMAYIKVTPTADKAPEAKIAYIMLSSRSGKETLAGRFHLYFNNGSMAPVEGHANNRTYVVMNGPEAGVELGKPFIISIPVQNYAGGLLVRIVDTEGNYMDRNLKAFPAVAGNLYNITTPFNPTQKDPVVATACEVSSSTANFTWTLGKGAANDVAQAWTIELAKDAAFTNKVVSRNITAGNGCWKSIQPKFCFGGLEQGTQYFFRACITDQDNWSDVVSATTTTFDLTVVTENAQAGDVILAEDFHDSCEGGESVAKAAGFGVKQNALKTYTDAGATMNNASTWSPWADASFGNWGWTRPSGSATFYPNQGHIKLGRAGDNSFAVTSKLSAISGFADIEVEVTAAVYPDATDREKTKEFFVATLKGEFDANHTIAITTMDLPGKVVIPMTDNTKWVTYKATLYGVAGDDRLVIGSNYDAGNVRLLISDVRVTVKAVSSFAATATEVSSSTVSFTWGYAGATAAEDSNHPYEIALYKDEACSELVVSHKISSGNACWNSRKPKFCFGCLEPNTTYYFKAKDTSEGGLESPVVSSKTAAFTNVTMPTAAASVGDIILAEDFSEINGGGEAVIASAAAVLNTLDEANVYKVVLGKTPTVYFAKDSEEKNIFHTKNQDDRDKSRLKSWSYVQNGSSSVYGHLGFVKLGTSSNLSWITTPVLSAIPAGKKADLEITVTLATWSGAVTTALVMAGNAADASAVTAATNVISSSLLTTKVGAWTTYTVTLSGVDNTMRLAIGPNTDTSKTAKSKGRMMINDVVVKIKDLK